MYLDTSGYKALRLVTRFYKAVKLGQNCRPLVDYKWLQLQEKAVIFKIG